MKPIAYTRPDGGVSIMVPIMKARKPHQTEAEFLAGVRARQIPADAANVVEVEEADIPKDEEFRDAWEITGGKIGPNLAKAKAIQEARIRDAKLRKARELLEREMAGEDVAAEKTELQAIDPPAIVAPATDVPQVKAAWPAKLPR